MSLSVAGALPLLLAMTVVQEKPGVRVTGATVKEDIPKLSSDQHIGTGCGVFFWEVGQAEVVHGCWMQGVLSAVRGWRTLSLQCPNANTKVCDLTSPLPESPTAGAEAIRIEH